MRRTPGDLSTDPTLHDPPNGFNELFETNWLDA